MPVIDNLNNGQKANGIPFTSLPEESSPSDYGYMVVTDDILKLKRITRGNFFKGIFAGGNVLSGRGLPDDGLGHDGDIYANLGTDITTITDFQVNTLPLSFWSWWDGNTKYGHVSYDIPSITPYQPEYMSYHSENGVLNNLNIRNYKCSGAQKYKGTNTELYLKDYFDRGGVIGFVFSGIIEESDYPVQYPAGIYNISFDLTIQGPEGSLHGRTVTEGETVIGEDGDTYWNCTVTTDPYIGVTNFTTNYAPASSNRRDYFGYRTSNVIAHIHTVCLDEQYKPEDYGKVVTNRYNYEYQSAPEWWSCIPIENEFGTYHVDFTSEVKGNRGSPSFMLDLSAAKCDIVDGGPASFTISNLRITPVTIYAEAIQDIWLKSEGRWNKDNFVLDDDIDFDCPAYLPGTTIASVRYKGDTYFLKVPQNYSDVDSVGISREYQTGTELFYIDIDGQRTRVYNPPSEYEVGYTQGTIYGDPSGRKLYTDVIREVTLNTLKTTYSGNTNFMAEGNALYKVVFHINFYKNDRGNLVCYTNKESLYAKLNNNNSSWHWAGKAPELRIAAKDFERTRFSAYGELIGYIETDDFPIARPAFSLNVGGKNFMYSNSYELAVYYSMAITRIR